MAKAKKNYIENDDLRRELILSHEKDQVTNELLAMFQLQIEKQMSEFRYKNPDDKHDVASGTLCVVLRKWRSCDYNRDKPFAWFTRVIYNAMYHYWNKINEKNKLTVSFDSIFEESV